MTGLTGRARGIVTAQLSGAAEDLDAVTGILSGYGVEVLEQTSPGPGRRDLTVLLQHRVEETALRHERDQAVAAVELATRWLEQARAGGQGLAQQDLIALALGELAFSLPAVPR